MESNRSRRMAAHCTSHQRSRGRAGVPARRCLRMLSLVTLISLALHGSVASAAAPTPKHGWLGQRIEQAVRWNENRRDANRARSALEQGGPGATRKAAAALTAALIAKGKSPADAAAQVASAQRKGRGTEVAKQAAVIKNEIAKHNSGERVDLVRLGNDIKALAQRAAAAARKDGSKIDQRVGKELNAVVQGAIASAQREAQEAVVAGDVEKGAAAMGRAAAVVASVSKATGKTPALKRAATLGKEALKAFQTVTVSAADTPTATPDVLSSMRADFARLNGGKHLGHALATGSAWGRLVASYAPSLHEKRATAHRDAARHRVYVARAERLLRNAIDKNRALGASETTVIAAALHLGEKGADIGALAELLDAAENQGLTPIGTLVPKEMKGAERKAMASRQAPNKQWGTGVGSTLGAVNAATSARPIGGDQPAFRAWLPQLRAAHAELKALRRALGGKKAGYAKVPSIRAVEEAIERNSGFTAADVAAAHTRWLGDVTTWGQETPAP